MDKKDSSKLNQLLPRRNELKTRGSIERDINNENDTCLNIDVGGLDNLNKVNHLVTFQDSRFSFGENGGAMDSKSLMIVASQVVAKPQK